jgi:hypothetical protein
MKFCMNTKYTKTYCSTITKTRTTSTSDSFFETLCLVVYQFHLSLRQSSYPHCDTQIYVHRTLTFVETFREDENQPTC